MLGLLLMAVALNPAKADTIITRQTIYSDVQIIKTPVVVGWNLLGYAVEPAGDFRRAYLSEAVDLQVNPFLGAGAEIWTPSPGVSPVVFIKRAVSTLSGSTLVWTPVSGQSVTTLGPGEGYFLKSLTAGALITIGKYPEGLATSHTLPAAKQTLVAAVHPTPGQTARQLQLPTYLEGGEDNCIYLQRFDQSSQSWNYTMFIDSWGWYDSNPNTDLVYGPEFFPGEGFLFEGQAAPALTWTEESANLTLAGYTRSALTLGVQVTLPACTVAIVLPGTGVLPADRPSAFVTAAHPSGFPAFLRTLLECDLATFGSSGKKVSIEFAEPTTLAPNLIGVGTQRHVGLRKSVNL